jgi:biopolymer transport protein ExbD
MLNNLFMLLAALVIAAILITAGTIVHLSKTSEYSRASDSPTELPSTSGSGSGNR